MKILVVGKSGQVARALADAAVSTDLDVGFIARPELDLALLGTAATYIEHMRPDLVINAAAYTQVDKAEDERDLAFRINADAAGEIAASARRVGAGIMQISTDYVFNGDAREPYVESAPTDPINAYGASKLAGEIAVAGENADHLIVRTSWLVSAYGHNFLKTMLRLAEDRDEVAVVADQVGRPTSAHDLADILLTHAAKWDAGERGIVNITNVGDPASWADFAEHIFDARRQWTGKAPHVRRITTADFPTPARRPAFSVLDCSRVQRNFGVQLRDWRHATADIVRQLHA